LDAYAASHRAIADLKKNGEMPKLPTGVVVISGIELAEKIKKGQFKLGKLGGRPATMPEVWQDCPGCIFGITSNHGGKADQVWAPLEIAPEPKELRFCFSSALLYIQSDYIAPTNAYWHERREIPGCRADLQKSLISRSTCRSGFSGSQ
jgi:hypothetical protein